MTGLLIAVLNNINKTRNMVYAKRRNPLDLCELEQKARYFIKILEKLRYQDIVILMYKPTDPSSLGIIRFLFGLLMTIDVFEERGGSEIDIRWGNEMDCHFPIASFFHPMPYPYMCLTYGIMWLGALGIMLGFKFRLSSFMFGFSYWYILLLDKSFWNNHSYLYGIVTILLVGSSANHFFSVDCWIDKRIRNKPVPYWNYFILKYQFFMLYFLAGLKKTDPEWLEGYSLMNLGQHWIFSSFRIILSSEQIVYLVVHWLGFLLDLTIGFWMILEISRPIAMVFCTLFHLMNSRLFSIGMFPYVCLVTMPLFCGEDWPRRIWSTAMNIFLKKKRRDEKSLEGAKQKSDSNKYVISPKIKLSHKCVVMLLLTHMGLQAFLPFSHFITKGYNNWTKGLYGYSWDMMVHSWDTVLVIVKVVDNDSGRAFFLDPQVWSYNNRWNQHADMSLQYANCVKRNLEKRDERKTLLGNSKQEVLSQNISIFIDVWCSLNKRFQQRMYDPTYDLMKANWSPFQSVKWLMPVLSEYNDFRRQMKEISERLSAENNRSDVLFVADFPGLFLENYIEENLENVSLTVLVGEVVFEMENEITMQSVGVKLKQGDSISVPEGYYHKIHTMNQSPSCYMYTFTRKKALEKDDDPNLEYKMYSPFPLLEDLSSRKESLLRMMHLIWNATTYLLFGMPLEIDSNNSNK